MMKRSILIILLGIPLLSFGQYTGFLREAFIDRLPSARAEAMGRGYASIDGDLATIFFNPAGTATLDGLEVYSSFASPYYGLDSAKYDFISAGIRLNKWAVALSRNHLNYGQELTTTDLYGRTIDVSIRDMHIVSLYRNEYQTMNNRSVFHRHFPCSNSCISCSQSLLRDQPITLRLKYP